MARILIDVTKAYLSFLHGAGLSTHRREVLTYPTGVCVLLGMARLSVAVELCSSALPLICCDCVQLEPVRTGFFLVACFLRPRTVVSNSLGRPLHRGEATRFRHVEDHLHGARSVLRRCGSERVREVPKLSDVSRRRWSDLSRRARSGRRHSRSVWLTQTTDVGNRALCSRPESIQNNRQRPCGLTDPFSGVHMDPPISAEIMSLVHNLRQRSLRHLSREGDAPSAVTTL